MHNHTSSATQIISNNEIEEIIKIVKSLEDSRLLWKGVSEAVQNKIKVQKGGFLRMPLGNFEKSLIVLSVTTGSTLEHL